MEENNDDEPSEQAQMIATRTTLWRDRRLMSRAVERLAQLSTDDLEEEATVGIRSTRRHGKKSGSVLTASDSVARAIDWPHLYVKRAMDGRWTTVNYSEFRIEEFMYGFDNVCSIIRSACSIRVSCWES